MSIERRAPIVGDALRALTERSRGVLTYKYLPKTQDWGAPDAEYVSYTPPIDTGRYVRQAWAADGSLSFRESSWEDLPTLCHIVNALASLPVREWRGAVIQKSVGGTDYRIQQVLE
jgi:hypothetical protein